MISLFLLILYINFDIEIQCKHMLKPNQMISIIIATDGLCTDGDVLAAFGPLRTLPVSVCIRLCTDEETVVDYWEDIAEKAGTCSIPMCLYTCMYSYTDCLLLFINIVTYA